MKLLLLIATACAVIAGVVLVLLGNYFNGGFVIVFMSVMFCYLWKSKVEK